MIWFPSFAFSTSMTALNVWLATVADSPDANIAAAVFCGFFALWALAEMVKG
jgi:hypothetical protein